MIADIGKVKPTSRKLLKSSSDLVVQCLRRLLLGDEAPMTIIVGKRVHLAATVHVIDGKTAAPGLFTRESERQTQAQNTVISRCARRGAFHSEAALPVSQFPVLIAVILRVPLALRTLENVGGRAVAEGADECRQFQLAATPLARRHPRYIHVALTAEA